MGADRVLGITSGSNKPLRICILWEFTVDNTSNGKQVFGFSCFQSTDWKKDIYPFDNKGSWASLMHRAARNANVFHIPYVFFTLPSRL